MFRERGGSSSFARHAFNELIAFIAGWAILIDYLIVDRAGGDLGARTTWSRSPASFSEPGWEIGVAALVIVAACVLNILNVTGRGRERPLAVLALADLALQLAVIVVGVLVVLHPDRLTDSARPLHQPERQRHRLRLGGRDARLRRDRGRLRPRARHRRRAAAT